MLLVPNDDGSHESLARWDFAPSAAQAATCEIHGQPAIQFPLELPPETPIVESTQLWVRIHPRDAGKLLAHLPIDLHAPASEKPDLSDTVTKFAESSGFPLIRSIAPVMATSSQPIRAELNDAGWAIARPGEKLEENGNTAMSGGQWRTSTQPIIEPPSSTKLPPVHTSITNTVRPAPVKQAEDAIATERSKPTRWAPQRANDSGVATTAKRPRWSAIR